MVCCTPISKLQITIVLSNQFKFQFKTNSQIQKFVQTFFLQFKEVSCAHCTFTCYIIDKCSTFCLPIYLPLTTGPLPVMRKVVFLFPKCSFLSIETPASVPVIQTRSPPVVLMTASAPAVSPTDPCPSLSYSPYIFYLLGLFCLLWCLL